MSDFFFNFSGRINPPPPTPCYICDTVASQASRRRCVNHRAPILTSHMPRNHFQLIFRQFQGRKRWRSQRDSRFSSSNNKTSSIAVMKISVSSVPCCSSCCFFLLTRVRSALASARAGLLAGFRSNHFCIYGPSPRRVSQSGAATTQLSCPPETRPYISF